MANQLFATKSFEKLRAEAEETEGGLKRALSAMNLVTLGIGAIIGAGIFTLTGVVAAQYTGPSITLSFIAAGVGCAFAGFCYAEMASMIPIAGSAYTYGYATLGELIAWIVGWHLILEYSVTGATVAVAWSGYVCSLLDQFGLIIPGQFRIGPTTTLVQLQDGRWVSETPQLIESLAGQGIDAASLAHVNGIINLPAIIIVCLVTVVLVRGIKESANINSAIVVLKVSVIVLFAIIGFFYVSHKN